MSTSNRSVNVKMARDTTGFLFAIIDADAPYTILDELEANYIHGLREDERPDVGEVQTFGTVTYTTEGNIIDIQRTP